MADDTRRDDPGRTPRSDEPVPRGDRVVREYDDERRERDDGLPATIRRISWGAIFAGAVVAIVLQLMLNLLGLGFGFNAINLTETSPFSGVGIGTIIWLIVATLISLFAGGWVAGRLAGMPRRVDAALHGFVTWGLATLFAIYLLTTAVGSIVSGVTGLVGQGLSAAGQGVASVAPQIGDAAQEALRNQGITLQSIKQEAQDLLQQSGLEEEVAQAADTAQAQAGDIAQAPANAQQNINQAIEQFLETGQAADRENVVNILVARTDMSRAEAQQTVEQYEQQYQQARQQVQQRLDSLRQRGIRAGGTATNVISTIGFVAFLAMLIGAAAATGGGAAGAPHDLPASSSVRRE